MRSDRVARIDDNDGVRGGAVRDSRVAVSIFSTVAKYGRFIRNGVSRRAPVQLTLFITSRCNIRCKMCFYWEPVEATTDCLDNDCDGSVDVAAGGEPMALSLSPTTRNDVSCLIGVAA